MLPCFTNEVAKKIIPIEPIVTKDFSVWLANQGNYTQQWLRNDVFKADVSTRCLIKDESGEVQKVLLGIDSIHDFWSFAILPVSLPSGIYKITSSLLPAENIERAALGFALGTYQYKVFKKTFPSISAKLFVADIKNLSLVENLASTIFWVRDLINTPANIMTPAKLAETAAALAGEFAAEMNQIIGDDLIAENYPTIYTVGAGSQYAPRLIDIRWGNKNHRKVTLVGKGVCFDSGGLDIKTSGGMLLMKKDMAGAAHALGLARMIMKMQLPICLRILIPAVENSVSATSYRPGDIITTRKGISVEVTNTDAEGRLVLCDALAEAAREKPEMIIDFATLTGAAHIALGPELPALYCNDEALAQNLLNASQQVQDPMWRMPLYKPYRRYLDSPIADIMNASFNRYAGSIVAALFLKDFVNETPWAHFDFMAWNPETKFGRMQGAEVLTLRAVYEFLSSSSLAS